MSDVSDRRIVKGRIRRLELLLRMSSGDRARDVRAALDELYRQVEVAPPRPTAERLMKNLASSASGVNGVGGLRFEANAPPGLGRMVAVPLFLFDMDPQPTFPAGAGAWSTVTTSAGVSAVDERNPTVVVNIPPLDTLGNANRKVRGLRFRTPILEWATVRIVGFQVSARCVGLPADSTLIPAFPPAPNGGAPPIPIVETLPFEYTSGQRPLLMVKNLNVGGSANLFPQGEYADATVYSTRLPEYAGLRDNPILESPNRAFLTAAVVGVPFTSMTLSMQIIVDILDDTEFGRHMPGPYARRGAQGRTPSIEANAFVGG